MKYVATDELHNFDYHDAELMAMDWHGKDFVWQVKSINASAKNTKNNHPKDMCIKYAKMVFKDACIENIVFSGYKTYSADGTLLKSVEAETAAPEEYEKIINNSTSTYCYIFGMVKQSYIKTANDRFSVCFDIDGGEGHCIITISFTEAIVSWDEFSGEAWYEHPKWKKKGQEE